MHRREEHSRSNRYGGSRVGTGPYDRKPALTWRQKPIGEQKGNRVELATNSGDIVPYEHSTVSRSDGKQSTEVMRSQEITVTRRLASTIITPSRADLPMEENVTKGVKEATRSLSFYVLSDHELQDGVGDGQIIGAFSDMEIADQHDGEIMDYDVGNDDLLGVGDKAQKRMSLWAFRVENLRFFVGDLRESVRHRLMLMQENLGTNTKVQKSLELVHQQDMV
ncbi:hypothetical protein Bca52824_073454 [Brassica carinata]|uniref:Uncharacterized protein n=1 Tax=Brassica carinata TaxID=52824 RepID=A0A8X7QA26_BRACI|nr:hypothetical protein Bca52824_073454 [Brassica carinata]